MSRYKTGAEKRRRQQARDRSAYRARRKARDELVLRPHHIEALKFLQRHPGDEVGVIETDEQFAAAVVFCQLMRAGFVRGSLKSGDGGCFITEIGSLAIAETGTQQ